jgi:hypothetical protein
MCAVLVLVVRRERCVRAHSEGTVYGGAGLYPGCGTGRPQRQRGRTPLSCASKFRSPCPRTRGTPSRVKSWCAGKRIVPSYAAGRDRRRGCGGICPL